ncbi:MAG: alpha-L-fucosidase [Saprospiraceae bacterium]|nr:alpha-L-fucosidase [Saprospiraceae bacterium]MBK6816622.1 alpha-L-fucosidase [Saprospiraceae bacterium]MBK9679975.1 alpha-L-fucosidase [Saprospiraceae bacterium]
MKTRLLVCMLFLTLMISINAQTRYDPTFQSLDSRPIPSWFEDAKFGIFIHWGPYSVPAWSPKGSYSEWYQRWLLNKKTGGNVAPGAKEIWQHHEEVYGPHYSYYNFGDEFKASDFDPKYWAKLFENAGAKYIVLTSKHHDGFCLWPSMEADRTWGFPWNSYTTGAKRDLIGDLKAEVDKTSVKFGLYYSMYEWYNPLYLKPDKKDFVENHMLPQMHELIDKYQPWSFWTDGSWDHPSEVWKSKEFLAWLFNDSPVKNTVVVNGRWGSDIKKGGPYVGNFISTEYDGVEALSRPWEECRGIGFSFGYNSNEDIADYNSSVSLVHMLIDIVSHGGNLLLDIGPDGQGKIPPVMQERLLDIGDWLKINGEAIYGTRKWKNSAQWSAGKQSDGDTYKKEHKLAYLGGDFILKQTIDPDPGYAVKELFFTTKDSNLYVILPKWNSTGKIVIKGLNLNKNKVIMVESGQVLKYKNSGPDVEVSLPVFDPNVIKSKYAYVIRIEGVS